MKLFFLISLILLSSCTLQPRNYQAPDGLIPKDSMIMIMKDLSVLESYIHQKHVQLERYALLMRMSGDSLLQDYDISRERYEQSMEYYGKNPKEFIQIYDAIIEQLEGSTPITDIQEVYETFQNE